MLCNTQISQIMSVQNVIYMWGVISPQGKHFLDFDAETHVRQSAPVCDRIDEVGCI